MRILHTSDWHLGRNFHGVNLLDSQVKTLQTVVDIVKEESVDVVVVAGDIYDRAIPSSDAVKVLSEALGAIRGAGAHVVGISGNHDSADRIGFAESVMSHGGVSLRGDLTLTGQPVLIPNPDGGEVAFYPIPYLEVDRARYAFDAPEARSHEKLLSLALERARLDRTTRAGTPSVAIVHAFVTGGQSCDSELALSVGGSSEVALNSLGGFDYVALGHLHGRQSLGSGTARYSGSLLPYSFSERNHTKGAWLVDIDQQGQTKVESIDFPVFRQLHQIKGELAHLLDDTALREAEDGFVQAILTDPLLPLDAMGKLRRRFPHAVVLMHEPPTVLSLAGSYSERIKGKSDLDLTCDFIEHVSGRPTNPDEILDLTMAIEPSIPGEDVVHSGQVA